MYGKWETGDVCVCVFVYFSIHPHKLIEHFENLYIRSAANTEKQIMC